MQIVGSGKLFATSKLFYESTLSFFQCSQNKKGHSTVPQILIYP